MKSSNEFIILGTQRTGSCYLKSMLNSHPQIFCADEILIQPQYLKELTSLSISKDKIKKFSSLIRDRRYVEFINYFFSLEPSNGVISRGFKYFYTHLQGHQRKDVLDYFINKNNLKIIHLQRKNLLKQYVSLILAKKTNIWTTRKTDIKVPKINVDPNLLSKYLINSQKEVIYHKKFFQDSHVLDVYYEDIIIDKNKQCNRILKFLNVDLKILESPFKKINTASLKDTVSNYSELKNKFKDAPWIQFFEE